MECVGFLDDDAVLPVVGWEEGADHGRLCVNLEVYHSSAHSLVVVQQRSPAVRPEAIAFARRVATWVQVVLISIHC
jgi:predicted ATP-grasp superfamily ATP-dependent carboligase